MAVINLITALVSALYFSNRKRVNVECKEKTVDEDNCSSGKTSTNEFSIFTIEDKLVATSGSISKINNNSI